MKKIFYTFFSLGIIFSGAELKAQQDPQLSQYMFNTLYYNPGYAGVIGVTKLTALYRNQWTGYVPTIEEGGAPNTQIATFETPILKFRSGFGATFVRDNLGPQSNLQAQVAYAYHLGLKNSKLSFGISAGIYSQSIDFNNYRYIKYEDKFGMGKESQVRPDMALGFYYQAEKYFAGASFNHILKSEFDFGSDSYRNALSDHSYFTAGYHYEVNYNFVVTPSVLVKTDFNTYSVEASVLGTYNEKIYGGFSFRQGDAAIVLLGFSMFKDNSLRAGYAFDYVIKAQDAKAATSHEIMVSYELPMNTAGGKKIIRTPRFRH
jgi:type IX secretion system PorP/SprF family membrane protein